jgi:hypothetical protein
VREGGGLIGARGEAKSEQNRRIKHVRFSLSQFVLSETWERRVASMLASSVGSTYQPWRKRERVPVQREG